MRRNIDFFRSAIKLIEVLEGGGEVELAADLIESLDDHNETNSKDKAGFLALTKFVTDHPEYAEAVYDQCLGA